MNTSFDSHDSCSLEFGGKYTTIFSILKNIFPFLTFRFVKYVRFVVKITLSPTIPRPSNSPPHQPSLSDKPSNVVRSHNRGITADFWPFAPSPHA